MAYKGNMFKQLDYQQRKRKDLQPSSKLNTGWYVKYKKEDVFNVVSFDMVILRLILIVVDIVSIILGIINYF